MGLFGKKKKTAVVGLYGKHPAADDFLRLNASSPEIRALDEWLSGALAAAGRLVPDWETAYGGFASIFFICGSGGVKGASCLLGALAPSTDRIGRQYPLVLFASLDESLVAKDFSAAPYSSFLEEVEALLGRRTRLGRDSLFDAVGSLRPPDEAALADAQRAHGEYLDGTTCSDAFRLMFADAGQEERALGIVREACGYVTPGHPPPGFGVRFPLGARRVDNAALWLGVLQQLLPQGFVPNALWSGSTMLTYFSRLPAKALTALWHTGWKDDSLYDLATESSDRARLPIPAAQPLRALLTAIR
jgi:type VI secretion system protein ImpM